MGAGKVRLKTALTADETIGETVETAWLSVPPQQARGLDEHVSFSNLAPVRGNLEWDWEVSGLKGRPAAPSNSTLHRTPIAPLAVPSAILFFARGRRW